MNKTFNGGNACFECLAAWRINHRYGASFGRHRTEPTLLASLMLALSPCEECRSPSVLNPSIFKTAKTSRQRVSPKVRSLEHAPQHGLVVPHGLSSSLGLHQMVLIKGYWPNAAGRFFPRHTPPVNLPPISIPSKCSCQFCTYFMEYMVW